MSILNRFSIIRFGPLLFLTLLPCISVFPSDFSPVTVLVEAHPDVSEEMCKKLAVDKDNQIYNQLLREKRVELINSSYIADRKFYPCMQTLRIEFHKEEEYYQHLEGLHGCFTYYFFGNGADYSYHKAITAHSANVGDQRAYDIFLRKDGRCVNETTDHSYRQLLENPDRFFRTFGNLSKEQQKIVANVFSYHEIHQSVIRELQRPEKIAAIQYNLLIKKHREYIEEQLLHRSRKKDLLSIEK